jgi:ABC-2 type transport system permease protein
VTTDVEIVRALLWKAWLETRTRLLGSAAILSLLGISTVLRARPTIESWESFHSGETMPYALYVWLSLSHGYLMFFWVICAVLLGLGGLGREQSAGTAGFTLALPVSRSSLVATRAMVGAAGALVLAVIPGVLVALLSPIIGEDYALSQGLGFGVLMGVGGMVFYALGFLLSHLMRGEYAAPGLGLALTAALYVLVKVPGFHVVDVFRLMTGSEYMAEGTYLLGPSFPLGRLALPAAIALLLVIASDVAVRRRDF